MGGARAGGRAVIRPVGRCEGCEPGAAVRGGVVAVGSLRRRRRSAPDGVVPASAGGLLGPVCAADGVASRSRSRRACRPSSSPTTSDLKMRIERPEAARGVGQPLPAEARGRAATAMMMISGAPMLRRMG